MRKLAVILFIGVIGLIVCGCIYNPENSNLDNTNEFKVVKANEDRFKEFVSRLSTDNYYRTVSTAVSSVGVRGNTKIESLGANNNVERYSETNVQVKGVDEADIVKNNGSYIFYSPERYPIVRISHNYYYPYNVRNTYIIKALPPKSADIIGNISHGGYLYLYKNNLIIIDYNSNEILDYNVSNPKNPKLKWKLDINGSYVDSRVYNGKLYLIVAQNDIYCPIIWNGVKINYNSYYIPIVPRYVSNDFDRNYIISSIDVNSGNITKSIATAGSYETTVYMSKNNIYFAYHLRPNENKMFLNFLKENSNKYLQKILQS